MNDLQIAALVDERSCSWTGPTSRNAADERWQADLRELVTLIYRTVRHEQRRRNT